MIHSVTRFGDLSPFWGFLDVFGDNFLPKIAKKKYFYKSFDVDILAFKKRAYYCGDKFGDFSPKAGVFFSETPGHSECECETLKFRKLRGR